MRYVHIGLNDQAKASPTYQPQRCISGVADQQSVSADGSPATQRERLTPCNRRGLGVECHSLALGEKMEDRGLEPLSNSAATNSGDCGCEECREGCAAPALHNCGSKCLKLSELDADLQAVILAWDEVPEAIRKAIAVMVHSQR